MDDPVAIRRCKGGDKDAFRYLVERYQCEAVGHALDIINRSSFLRFTGNRRNWSSEAICRDSISYTPGNIKLKFVGQFASSSPQPACAIILPLQRTSRRKYLSTPITTE